MNHASAQDAGAFDLDAYEEELVLFHRCVIVTRRFALAFTAETSPDDYDALFRVGELPVCEGAMDCDLLTDEESVEVLLSSPFEPPFP